MVDKLIGDIEYEIKKRFGKYIIDFNLRKMKDELLELVIVNLKDFDIIDFKTQLMDFFVSKVKT